MKNEDYFNHRFVDQEIEIVRSNLPRFCRLPTQQRRVVLKQNGCCRNLGATPDDADVVLEIEIMMVQRPKK